MYVKDVMQTALTTVTPDTRVGTAYQIMTMRGARIRHLPVVTDKGNSRLGSSRTAMCAVLRPPMRRLWPSTSCSPCWKSSACGTS